MPTHQSLVRRSSQDGRDEGPSGDGGRIVGFCSLHFRTRLNYASEQAWVPDLIVTAEARRRRVAWALLEEAERLRAYGKLLRP